MSRPCVLGHDGKALKKEKEKKRVRKWVRKKFDSPTKLTQVGTPCDK